MEHFSLSQARLANSCPLSWWYRYKSGRDVPVAGQAAQAGSEMDELLNGAFSEAATGYNPAYFDDEVWADFIAVMDAHPIKLGDGRPQVEILVDIPGIPIPVLGYADLVTSSTVWEHKRGGGWDAEWWDAARRQVSLYAHALDKKWGGIVQVKDGRVHIEQFEITTDLVYSVWAELLRGWVAADSFEDAEVSARPGKACAWCSYEPTCPESVFKSLR